MNPTPTQRAYLEELAANPSFGPAQLSRVMGRSKSTAKHMLDTLQALGFIEPTSCPECGGPRWLILVGVYGG